MDSFRPIYTQTLDVRIPGFIIHRLRLNRHRPDSYLVDPHDHDFAQFLLYLNGRGSQIIRDVLHEIRPGALIYLPPHHRHSFLETAGRRPLCLAIDFQCDSVISEPVLKQLNQIELAAVKRCVSRLSRWRNVSERTTRNKVHPAEAAAVLELIDLFMRAIGALPPQRSPQMTIVRKIQKLLIDQPNASVHDLAQRCGYDQSHLNRLLKSAIGLTLGQLQAEQRLERAKELLTRPGAINELVNALGFTDQNYFSRWFRLQTGLTPTQWRLKHQSLRP